MKSISIVGCGWLGLPLAEHLVDVGYTVKGTTSTKAKLIVLAEKDIQSYLYNAVEAILPPNDFFQADAAVITLPPSKIGKYYAKVLENLARKFKEQNCQQILFTSSIGVYKDYNGSISETAALDRSNERSERIIQAEEALQETFENSVILRLGGLIGKNRHPALFLTDRVMQTNAYQKINMVHLSDCIAAIHTLIAENVKNEVFNLVAPMHPAHEQFYTEYCKAVGLKPPTYVNFDAEHTGKIVSSKKITHQLGYQFIYSDPFDM